MGFFLKIGANGTDNIKIKEKSRQIFGKIEILAASVKIKNKLTETKADKESGQRRPEPSIE